MPSEWFDALAQSVIAQLLFPAAERQRSGSQRSATSRTSDEAPPLSPAIAGLHCPDPADFVQRKAPMIVREMMARTAIRCAEAYASSLRLKPLEELKAEKSRLKRELSAYDREFRRDTGRLPTDQEKVPMRLFYLCYKRLKQAMEQRDGPPGPEARDRMRGEVAARLGELHARKKRLNQLLFAFQKNFETSFGRPIRHSRDLQPVNDEYGEYQETKREIAALKSWLSQNS